MKMLFRFSLIGILVLLVATNAGAASVLYDTFSPGDGYSTNTWTIGWDNEYTIAMQFTPTLTAPFASFDLVSSYRRGAHTLIVSLLTDSLGAPAAVWLVNTASSCRSLCGRSASQTAN